MLLPILASNERLKLHSEIPANEVAHDYPILPLQSVNIQYSRRRRLNKTTAKEQRMKPGCRSVVVFLFCWFLFGELAQGQVSGAADANKSTLWYVPVSYTHLTLPTIYSV